MRRLVALALFVLALPAAGFAQGDTNGGGLVTGPLQWSPNLQLRDFGYDSNILQSPTNPQWDVTATLSPGTDASIDREHVKTSGTAALNLDYYEWHTDQRSIGGHANVRAEFPVRWFVPSLTGAYENLRERQAFEIDVPVRHTMTSDSVGLGTYLGTRGVVSAILRNDTFVYAHALLPDGASVEKGLNRRTQSEALTVRFNVTPFTSIVGDGSMSKDDYTLDATKDMKNLRANIGVEFTPDAIIRGHATWGYHDLSPADPLAVPFKGFTANVDLSYLLLSVTRISGHLNRDTSTSVEAPYYLETTYGIDIEQTFVGPFSLLVRYNHDLADYQAIEARKLPGHVDLATTYGGGIGIRLSNATRMTVNYELAQRRSGLPGGNYDRERVNTSVTMGF